MQPEGVSFVNVGVWLGLLRWITLGLLIVACFVLINKDKKEQKSKRSLAMLIFTVIAMPFLILEINFKSPEPENVDQAEEENLVPSKKPEIDDNPYLTPKDDRGNPDDSQDDEDYSENYSINTPSRSYRPKEAPKTTPSDEGGSSDTPVTPDEPVDPDAPTVNYTVIHKKMNLTGDDYEIADTDNLSGKARSKVTPSVKNYTGFTAPSTTTETLPEDDSLEITYLYKRNKYKLTINSGNVDTATPSGEYYYGTSITLLAKSVQGWTFAGWSNGSADNPITFELTGETTIEPVYAPNTDTAYRVSHQQMDLDGEHYTEVDHDDETGTTGTEVTPPVKTYEHFNSPATQTAVIAGDGSTNIIYKYDRKKYSYSYGSSEFVESSKPEGDYYYETVITIKAKNRAGYDFTQWSNGDTNQETTVTINGATTITPEYTARTDTPYMVRHRKMSADGSTYTEEEDPKTGTTDTEVTPATKTYTGYTAPNTQTVTISGDGNTEVIYEYTPNTYNVVFHANNGTGATVTQAVHYDEEFSLDANTFSKTHYSFNKWNTQDDGSGEWYDNEQQNIKNLAESGDFNLYAIWDADSYTIHYDKNNENATGSMHNQTAYFDQAFSLTQNAFRLEGHAFNGWSTDKDAQTGDYSDKANITTNLTEGSEVTLYAIWGRESYTVHFDLNYENPEGSAPADVTVQWGTMIGDQYPTDPTRTNYVLMGWFDDPTTETNRLTRATEIKSDKTYYAHWKKKITQADVDDIEVVRESSESITVRNESELEPFSCSSDDTSIATVDGGCTVTGVAKGNTVVYLYGQFSHENYEVAVEVKPIEYTVTIDSNNGSATTERKVEENTAIGTLPEPSYTDYTLVGWFINDTQINSSYTVSSDITITAHWLRDINTATAPDKSVTRTETVTVTIDNANEYEEYICTAADPTTIATVTSGCVVTGVAKGNATVTITGRLSGHTATANITVNPIMYTISFDVAGGSTVQDMDVEEYTQIGTLPSSDKQSYVLEGWYNNDTKIDSTFVPTGSITLTAHWLRDIETATAPAITLTRTDSATLTIENPSEYEEFECTASTDTSIATFTSACEITGIGAGDADITITGKISGHTKTVHITVNPIKYTISFNTGEGGPVVPEQEVVENTEIGTLPTPTKEGYTLEGWYTDPSDPTTKIDEHYVPTANVELFANWVEDGMLVCKVAEELLFETCKYSDSNGCGGLKTATDIDGGTIVDNTITYGKLPTSGDPEAGYAYDCDVNADGVYNSENERFYYLNKDPDTNVARLVYSNNYDIGIPGIDEYQSEPYDSAISLLPTEEIWTNRHLVKYDDGKIVRFPMQNDIASACKITGSLTDASTKKCLFMMQGTQFREAENPTGGKHPRAGIWLFHEEGGDYYRIQGKQKQINSYGATVPSDKNNAARPVIQVPLDYIEQPEAIYYTVEFDPLGGSEVAPITQEQNKTIELPTSTKAGFQLTGWSKTQDGSQVVGAPGENYTVTEDIKLYAVWTSNYVACYDDCDEETDFTSKVADAIAKAPNNTKKTVTLLKNWSESSSIEIDSEKNIELDLQNYTLSHSSLNIIKNYGTLTIKNGTISSSAAQGAINNESNAVLYVTGGTIKNTNSRQAIYNNGGQLYVSGDSVISSAAGERAAIHNLNNGTAVITGGTIISTKNFAIYNEKGSLTIGTKDGVIDTSTPTIKGEKYGVVAVNKDSTTHTEYMFYDGTIQGKTGPIGVAANTGNTPTISVDSTKSRISEIEDDSTYNEFTQDGYQVLQLETLTPKYLIQFDANGGTASEASRSIDQGAEVGTLPTADRGAYIFDGWFTEKSGGREINATETPDSNKTYYAHWHFNSSNEIIAFSSYTSVLNDYFNGIASWKDDKNTTLDELQRLFENNDCNYPIDNPSNDIDPAFINSRDYKSGNTVCSLPNGYDTGTNTELKVFLSDDGLTKGSRVYYTVSDNGKIYNLIPNQVYRWEIADDENAYGYVKTTDARRIINAGDIRNVRDLGGLPIDSDDDGNVDGTVKYGKLFRGFHLGTNQSDVDILENLGITEELNVTNSDYSGEKRISTYKKVSTNYWYAYKNDPNDPNELTNYNEARKNVVTAMEDIINDQNIYFHCTYGTDRAGTVAYILEGLLGVQEEARNQDFELSVFAGRIDRSRYYDKKDSNDRRYVYMHNLIPTSQDIYQWFMAGSQNTTSDQQLVEAFRAKMIDYN